MSIVAQKITYIHPDNQVLFKGIDLTINKGQKVALVGNNGSGKSTFLRILAGTLQAQEGEIIYNPQNEMFRLLGTKRSFSQNETFFFSHPYPPTLPFST